MSIGWHVLRFIVEAKSPISCATGTEGFDDTQLARDANGLPMIPGATLQGVFRSFCDETTANEMFGWFEEGRIGNKGVAHPGKLFFSNALVLGSDGKCAAPNEIINKSGYTDIFSRLLDDAPLKREHVRINELGTADGSGKYDRSAVPKGTRFAFEVMMVGTAQEKKDLIKLFAPLKSPFLRFGGRGRRGYGKVGLIKAKYKFFALDDFDRFRSIRGALLSDLSGLHEDIKEGLIATGDKPLKISLSLSNINPWRVGGDGVRTRVGKRRGKGGAIGDLDTKEAKFASTREPVIKWDSETNKGEWTEPSKSDLRKFVLYGTSLAGPLAHRTLFHFNCLSNNFIDPDATDLSLEFAKLEISKQNQKHLKSLFGEAADDNVTNDDDATGMASALFIDDVEILVSTTMTVDHVSIDRFTGGARQGMLYDEELIVTSKVAVEIYIDPRRWKMPEAEGAAKTDERVQNAFCLALHDLSHCALALGAKSYGFFSSDKPPEFSGLESGNWKSAYDGARNNNTLEDKAA